MLSLKERKARREHLAKVASGEIEDRAAMFGTDDNGNVIGDDGKPVEGTAPKGFDPNANKRKERPDYSKLTAHKDLDAALGERTKPEGWDDMKVADKQAWLAANEQAKETGATSW